MWKVVGDLGHDLIALVAKALPDEQQFRRLLLLVVVVLAFVALFLWLV